MESRLMIQDEVLRALEKNRPVVALESTIISHGMPYPENLKTAQRLEEVVRSHGAVPATVAIIGGFLKVGLNAKELSDIARHGPSVAKVSKRDLAYVLASGDMGATTVTTTIVASRLAGIKVFATGGIGGVHRGAEQTFDESADLVELSRSPVCVVCSGAKSILDIEKTLERLETLGVAVLTLASGYFPAFYSRSSGVKSPHTVRSVADAAAILRCSENLSLRSGILLAVPVPAEHEAEASKIDHAIQRALEEADKAQVQGRDVTPFVLSKVVELTDGEALRTNQRLAENNASVAARLAVMLCSSTDDASRLSGPQLPLAPSNPVDVLVVGATIVDIYSHSFATHAALVPGTSNPGTIRTSFGGVARNIAVALSLLGSVSVSFVTAVGSDPNGNEAVADLKESGVNTDHVLRVNGFRTSTYSAVNSQEGDLCVAVADTSLYESRPLLPLLSDVRTFKNTRRVVVDANIHVDEMKAVADYCRAEKVELFYEPTSVPKCVKVVQAGCVDAVAWTFPGEAEVVEMAVAAAGRRVRSAEEGAEVLLNFGVRRVVVTRGSKGVTLFRRESPKGVNVAPETVDEVANTSGAGDVLAAAVIKALSMGASDVDALKYAVRAAAHSVQSFEAVPKSLKSKL